MFSSRNVARLRTISRTKATRILAIVCMSQTVAGSGLKCQDFCSRRGFEERHLLAHMCDKRPFVRYCCRPIGAGRREPAGCFGEGRI